MRRGGSSSFSRHHVSGKTKGTGKPLPLYVVLLISIIPSVAFLGILFYVDYTNNPKKYAKMFLRGKKFG